MALQHPLFMGAFLTCDTALAGDRLSLKLLSWKKPPPLQSVNLPHSPAGDLRGLAADCPLCHSTRLLPSARALPRLLRLTLFTSSRGAC